MHRVIALVTRSDEEDERHWLERLRLDLPGETILSFRHMSAEDRAHARIAIVANPDPADIARLPHLEWIQSLWAGVERLVQDLATVSVPIVRLIDPQMSRTMAEAVLAWTYYLFRDMPAYARQQRERTWQQRPYRRAQDTTIGLIGLGTLGQAAAARLTGAGFAVAGWSRSRKTLEGVETFSGVDGLERMLAKTEIAVCLVPLTPETRGLVDRQTLSMLPKGAALINFARGPVVVTADLIAALDTGALAHAVLDVFEIEPLPVDDALWRHPSVTILPHISAPTDRETASRIVAGDIREYLASGRLPVTVDRTRGY